MPDVAWGSEELTSYTSLVMNPLYLVHGSVYI